MGNLTFLTAAFDPKQEERNGFSNGDYGRTVAYSDIALFWG